MTVHEDEVIALCFAHQYGLEGTTLDLIEEVYPDAPGGQAAAFSTPGTEHVMLQYYETLEDEQGLALRDFVQAWATGESP